MTNTQPKCDLCGRTLRRDHSWLNRMVNGVIVDRHWICDQRQAEAQRNTIVCDCTDAPVCRCFG